MKKIIISQLTLALTLAASSAFAICDGGSPDGTKSATEECDDGNANGGDSCDNDCLIHAQKQNGSLLYGSDTLASVMEVAWSAAVGGAANDGVGIDYGPLGSSVGQRQMEGGATNSGEPTCTPNGSGAANPGCQEISPMSRALNSGVCDDPESANEAEQLAICGDNLVLTVDNNDVCGGDLGASWKAVLIQAYTGCEAADGSSCVTAVPRLTRCARPSRSTLLSNWSNLVAGCGAGACSTGVRHLYRRDDGSGTTNAFGELLGLANSATTLAGRTAYRPALGACSNVAAPANHYFCDGGEDEAFFNDAASGATGVNGDPIRKACSTEDDLCNRDGQVGVVRAIKSVTTTLTDAAAFPPVQCTRNAFKLAPFDTTSCKVCPDGNAPISGSCWLPVYRDSSGNETFNCLNDRTSRPPGATSSFDGRAYNYLVNNAAAAGSPARVPVFQGSFPEVAQWRQNMANLNTGLGGAAGGAFSAANKLCQERDATRNIGCMTGNTTCALGYSGQESAEYDPVTGQNNGDNPANVAARLSNVDYTAAANGYGMYRKLYINAIGGFENITADCAKHTSSPGFCQAQVDLVNYFHNAANAASVCTASGYLPLPAGPECIGGQAAGTAGCGAPAVQALAECVAL